MKVSIAAARTLTGLALFVAASMPPRSSFAQSCPTPVGAAPGLAEQSTEKRLQFVRDSLRETAQKERRFAIAWGMTYLGLIAGSWTLKAISDDPDRIRETYFNTGSSLLGAVTAIIQPLLAIREHRVLERWLKEPQPPRENAQCIALAEAERHLARAALNEVSVHSAFNHISSLGFTAGLSLIVAYGLKRPSSAPLNLMVGVGLVELMIATRPIHAKRSLDRYRQGVLTPPPQQKGIYRLLPTLQATNGEYSLGLAGAF